MQPRYLPLVCLAVLHPPLALATQVFTLEQCAQMAVARHAVVLEGTVASMKPITKDAPAGCVWITRLAIDIDFVLAGAIDADQIAVETLSLPAEYQKGIFSEPTGCAYTFGDEPPPAIGAQAIFFLSANAATQTLMLPDVRHSVVRKPTQGEKITIFAGPAIPHSWSYFAYKQALQNVGDGLMLDGLAASSEAIVVVETGARRSWSVERADIGLLLPVQVIEQLKGNHAISHLLIEERAVDSDSRVRRTLSRLLFQKQLIAGCDRVVVFGSEVGGVLTPIPWGVLPILSDGTIALQHSGLRSDGLRRCSLAELKGAIRSW